MFVSCCARPKLTIIFLMTTHEAYRSSSKSCGRFGDCCSCSHSCVVAGAGVLSCLGRGKPIPGIALFVCCYVFGCWKGVHFPFFLHFVLGSLEDILGPRHFSDPTPPVKQPHAHCLPTGLACARQKKQQLLEGGIWYQAGGSRS